MNNTEKIFEILQKEEMKPADKEQIKTLTKNDPEALEFHNTYNRIKEAVRSGSHLTYDQLYNYILFKSNNEPDDLRIKAVAPLIEDHLRKCTECMEEFSILNEEYSEIENFVAFPEAAPPDTAANSVISQAGSRKMSFARYGFITFLTAGLLYLVAFFVSESAMDESLKYAALENDSDFYVTRGRDTDNFQKSANALENENYSEAITYLEQDIRNSDNNNNLFYSHYILGLTYLKTAEKDFIGLFPSYDKEKASAALSHLGKSIELNNSGSFPNVNYDAYYYMAKANLILGNKQEAEKNLNRVIENKGGKADDARAMLKGLKETE